MSAVRAHKLHTAPLRGSAVAPSRTTIPTLRVLPAPMVSRTRAPFLFLCIGLLLGSLLIALFLNTAMARGAYRAHDLQVQLARLAQTEQALEESLIKTSSPSELALRARDLGMIASPHTAFVNLEQEQVLGVPTPATQKVEE
ncbi:MAG TPA: hypothetical protein VK030_06440 [Actinomycetales bacterium]|nr:hypothetical protein [Actinomycetales bacterium]